MLLNECWYFLWGLTVLSYVSVVNNSGRVSTFHNCFTSLPYYDYDPYWLKNHFPATCAVKPKRTNKRVQYLLSFTGCQNSRLWIILHVKGSVASK